MRVVLINPSMFGKDLRWNKSAKYPPLGLAQIAAVLENNGHKVGIIDAEAEELDEDGIEKRVKSFKPDIVGLTSHTPKFKQLVQTVKILERVDPDVKIMVGGPHASLVPVKTMQDIPGIDFIIRDEGEYTTLELLDALGGRGEMSRIKGLVYKKGGKIVVNERRDWIENLDELPFPARHLLPDLSIYSSGFRYKRLPVTSMVTSRGCPYNCLFCDRVFGRRYRSHSADYIVAEIEHLIERYGIKEVDIKDDLFLYDAGKVNRFCSLIEKKDIDITWSCNARIDVLYRNRDWIKKVKNAGCWYISFGLESGNQGILNFIRKGITLEQVRKVVRWVHYSGIFTKGYFMLGNPTETESTIRDTINFAKSLPLDGVQFSVTVPYPDTELYEIALKHGTFDKDSYDKMSSHPSEVPYAPEGLTPEFMKMAQRRAYREFYFRPSYILRQLPDMLRNPNSLMKYANSGLAYFKV